MEPADIARLGAARTYEYGQASRLQSRFDARPSSKPAVVAPYFVGAASAYRRALLGEDAISVIGPRHLRNRKRIKARPESDDTSRPSISARRAWSDLSAATAASFAGGGLLDQPNAAQMSYAPDPQRLSPAGVPYCAPRTSVPTRPLSPAWWASYIHNSEAILDGSTL